jgi:hypothetical protein
MTQITEAIEITNTCACVTYNDDTGEWSEAPECWGDCWNDQVEQFGFDTEHLFVEHNQGFRITGFPVWNGSIDGTFSARTPEELLRAITPDRTEWRLTYKVESESLKCVLYHHDAPTGGSMTVTPL